MNSNTLIRAAAPAALVGAALGIPADVYHFAIDSREAEAGTLLFKLHGLLLVVAFALSIVALAGMALRLENRLGRAGAAGVVIAYAGTLLVLVNVGTEAFAFGLAPGALSDPTGYALAVIVASFALFSIGWLLVGLAVARSGLGSTVAASVLCCGALVGFTPLPGAYILLLAGLAATARSLSASSRAGAPAGAPARA
jgi:hypothetical protein